MVDRVGQQIGNYRLVRLLGEGGFAEVYLGEHMYMDTQVAIKVLHTSLAKDDIEQFRTEARTIAHLEHPHIVRVLDFGVENTAPYLIMAYASNGSLRLHHPRGTVLPLQIIITYVKQIAQALQYAHDRRVIHRDVKPENMLIGHRNEVLLSDFGIATVAHSTGSITEQGQAGTPSYMAPEQIQGYPRPASDQYALGIAVYEWLCGKRPFQGNALTLMYQHLYTPPPSLREQLPTISLLVEGVVMTALAKEPQQRFGSINDFSTALEHASQHSERSPSASSFNMSLSSETPLSAKESFIQPRADASSSPSELHMQLSPTTSQPHLSHAPTSFSDPPAFPPNLASLPDQISPHASSLASQLQRGEIAQLGQPSQHRDEIPSREPSLQQSVLPVNPSMQSEYPLSETFSQHVPQNFQHLPTYTQSQKASAKSGRRSIGLVGLTVLLLVLLLGGVVGYIALGLSNTTLGRGSTDTTKQPTAANPGTSIPQSTATVQNPVNLGWPVVDQYKSPEVADGNTRYMLSAYATDQSNGNTSGNPIHASGITCILWLTKEQKSPEKNLKPISAAYNPMDGELAGALHFDSTTPRAQTCDANGRGTWKYTVDPSVPRGYYYLAVVTDWSGVHYNWNWIAVTIIHTSGPGGS